MSDRDESKPPRLPPSGLADEILAGLADGRYESQAEDDAPGAGPSGPERVYLFADSLLEGEEEDERERGETRICVTFELDEELFALPVSQVREVIRVGEITPVPGAPFPVLGVTSLRGRSLPVVDLRARLGLEPGLLVEASRIVVLESRGRVVGLLVDAARQVTPVEVAHVSAPDAGAPVPAADLKGVVELDGRPLHLLDAERMLIVPEEPEG